MFAAFLGIIGINISRHFPYERINVPDLSVSIRRLQEGINDIRAKLLRFIAVIRSGIAKSVQLIKQSVIDCFQQISFNHSYLREC